MISHPVLKNPARLDYSGDKLESVGSFRIRVAVMKFVEMSGKTLLKLVNKEEMDALKRAGVTEHCLIRVNPQGDVEIRQKSSWGIIGGLIGDFEERVRQATGLEWA